MDNSATTIVGESFMWKIIKIKTTIKTLNNKETMIAKEKVHLNLIKAKVVTNTIATTTDKIAFKTKLLASSFEIE